MTVNSVHKLLSTDIPDPTDFPEASPGLRNLDSSLRCNICGELFDAPVTLPCGHCFCSCCIRTAMVDNQLCPNCRNSANEGHLRINPGMEEAVSAWKLARPYVLQLSKRAETRRMRASPRSQKHKSFTKRKRNVDSDGSSSGGVDRTPGPSKSIRLKQETGHSDDDIEMTIPTSDSREDEMSTLPNDSFVDCPLCTRRVRYSKINSHMDNNCIHSDSSDGETSRERRSKKSEWSKIMAPRNHGGKGKARAADLPDPGPLPKASYATLKDKQLKDMLSQHKLPITGDRSAWIARHKRWVTIYNANLDKSLHNRKTISELRKELSTWEVGKKTKKNHVNDVAAHEKMYRAEFANLTKAARPKKMNEAPNNVEESSYSKLDPGGQTSPARHVQPEDDAIVVVDSEEERLWENS